MRSGLCYLTSILGPSDRGRNFYKVQTPGGQDNSAPQDAFYSDGLYDENILPIGTSVLVFQPVNTNEVCYVIKVLRNRSRDKEFPEDSDGIPGQKANFIGRTSKIKDGERVLKSDFGSIKLFKDYLKINKDGSGMSLYSKNHIYSTYNFSTNKLDKTYAGYCWSGHAYRNFGDYGDEYNTYLSNSCNVDELYHEKDPVGIDGGKARMAAYWGKNKNEPIPITRFVYCDKPELYSGDDNRYESSGTNEVVENNVELNEKSRRDYSTCLTLAPEQLIEICYGNVLNTEGELLDCYYKPLRSSYNSKVNNEVKDNNIYRKRSLGYNFQLSTNSNSEYSDNFINNFVTSITKEGFLTLNIPKTNNYGTIPYSFNADFSRHNDLKSERIDMKSEFIPLSNYVRFSSKDQNKASQKISTTVKTKIFPDINENLEDPYSRSTGLLFKDFGSKNKSESGSSNRVMLTKYHNMYSAAEILFSNQIERAVIPKRSRDNCGYADGAHYAESFQIPTEFVTTDLDGQIVGGPKNRSYVVTKSSFPAIKTGGGVTVCGTTPDKLKEKPYTNSYEIDDKGKIVSDEDTVGFGGYSANLNFDGALIANIGKDDANGSSFIMDTAGSIVSWIGKDSNNRSVIMQTDGSVSLNIGSSKKENGIFIPPRFDLRVNVSSKPNLIDLEDLEESEKIDLINGGDFIMSVSKNGIVISGMNKDIPMVIKNEGDVCIESGKNIRLIAGSDILHKKPGMAERTIGNSEQNKTIMSTSDCTEDLLNRNYINQESSSGNIV